MTLPMYCVFCTNYDNGKCCHPDPFPGVAAVIAGERCESFDRNHEKTGGRLQ